jgi:hypothetical protein
VSGGSSPYKIHDTVTATISATTSNGKPMIVTMSFPDGSSCTNAGSGNTCGGPFTITSSGTFAFSGSATQGNVSVGAYKSIDVPDPLGSRLKVSDVLPIALGGTAQFSAVAVDNANNPIPLPAPIVWSSSGFGSINSNTGLFTAGMVAGTASIHAVSGVLQGDGSVMIGIPSLTVSASASIVHTGQSVGLTAVLNDPSTGKPLSPQPTFSWTATCGSVSGNASATFYAPADACAATITATAAGATASTSVQVVGPPQITIVTPAPNEALRSDPTNGEKLVNVAVTVTTDHPVTTIAVSGGAACSLGGAQTMSSCTSLVSTPIYSKKTVVVTANDTIGGISVDATPVSVSYEVFGPPTAAMSMSASAGSIAGRANVFKKGTKVTVTVTGDDSANQGIATPTTAAGIQTIWINDETTNGDSSSCWNQGTCAAAFSDVGDYSFSGLVINDAGVYAHPLAGVGFSIRGGTTYRWITPVPDPSGVPPSFLLGGTTKAIDLVVQPDLSGAGTSVKTIEFFSNGKSLGQGSNNFKGSLGFWGITWPLPTTVGINNLTAVITNDINMTTEVPPVTSIEMISTPLVTLSATSPAVNAAFKVNAPIILTAVPSRPVPTVELWVSSTPALLINKAGQSASPYSITWSTSVPGSYWLYARTQDPDNKVWVTSNPPVPFTVSDASGQVPPTLLNDPVSVDVTAGEAIAFHVNATGSPLNYQWQSKSPAAPSFADIPGETNASYTYSSSAATSDAGMLFRCVISNPLGTLTSGMVTVRLVLPPTITGAANATAAAGTPATVSVSATASGQISYQWYKAPPNGSFAAVAGETNPSCTTKTLFTADSGTQFKCQVTNTVNGHSATATSTVAIVTVTGPDPADNASILSTISVPEIGGGISWPIPITVRNTGNTTWTSAGGYKLSPLSSGWSSKGGDLDTSVAPNTNKIFTLIVTAPTSTGSYPLAISMMHGSQVFGQAIQATINVGVPVAAPELRIPQQLPMNGTIDVNFQSTIPYDLSITVAPASQTSSISMHAAAATGITTTQANGVTSYIVPQGQSLALSSIGLTPGYYKISVFAQFHDGSFTPTTEGFVTVVAATSFGNVRVYPNPWRADKPTAGITFDGLSDNSTVKIFDIAAHAVRTFTTSNASYTWDMTNESGDKVASGVYLYLVTNNQGQKVRGKFSIIK